MNTTNTARIITASAVRTRREALRIRILNFLAIDKTMRARDNLSLREAAVRREELDRIDAALRAHVVPHPWHLFR